MRDGIGMSGQQEGWTMRIGYLSILAALALAACGSEAPAPRDTPQTEALSRAEAGDALPVMGPERRILAFGNSLFAGYGVEQAESYPARLEASLRARSINARVTNAGVSGDTSAAGRQRLAFVLDSMEQPPDLAIVELGGNDLLRGIPPSETRSNLDAIVEELRSRGVAVLLMGMRAPPIMGTEFQAEFDALYAELASSHEAALVPFFLEPVYDQPAMMQPDRIHPTASGIEQLVSATLDDVVQALPPAN